MAYAIGYIVYGLDLTAASYGKNPEAYDALKDIGVDILSEHFENETKGFEQKYAGSGDMPAWFGITLGQIDECDSIDGQWLINKLTLTDESKQAYQDLIISLEAQGEDEEFLTKLKSFEPKVMILWGSS